MDRNKNKPGPKVPDRHPGPAEMARLIHEQNELNGRFAHALQEAPTLQARQSSDAHVYAAINALHEARVRKGV